MLAGFFALFIQILRFYKLGVAIQGVLPHSENRRQGNGNRPELSFRGAKRRGNPLNRNANPVAIAIDLACFRNHYRAENLCYQFEQG